MVDIDKSTQIGADGGRHPIEDDEDENGVEHFQDPTPYRRITVSQQTFDQLVADVAALTERVDELEA